MATCANCGEKLLDGALFCTNCGAKVTEAEPAEQPEPIASPDWGAEPVEQPEPIASPDWGADSAEQPELAAESDWRAEPVVQPDPEEVVRQALAEDEQETAEAKPQPQPRPQPVPEYTPYVPQEQPEPEPAELAPADKPITTLGFVGIMLLLCIPVLNLLLLIIWACGGCRKTNKKNFSRAILILWGLGLLAAIIVTGMGFLVLGADTMLDLWDMFVETVGSLF